MSSGSTKGPVVILTPCSNSHPFEERRIVLLKDRDYSVKVGRAVARLLPASNNAIFDCKVLSRTHAVIWYDDSQFVIRDSKSSNGTFINNQRLSNSGEESEWKPLHSGDILQLGVEIIDNVKKVSSGCITCIVRLINENGEECVNPRAEVHSTPLKATSVVENERLPADHTLISNDKLFMMTQYMKEAIFRESLLTQKLRTLESLLETAEEASENSWQALINEERLLSRIEILESQLAVYANKNTGNDDLRKEIHDVYEDRTKAELIAKDLLRKAEEQVYETTMHLHDVEKSLVNIEEENAFLRRQCENYEQELHRRSAEHEELYKKHVEAQKKLEELNGLPKSDAETSTSFEEKSDSCSEAVINGLERSSDSTSSRSPPTAQSISTESGMEFTVLAVEGQQPSKKGTGSPRAADEYGAYNGVPPQQHALNGVSDEEAENPLGGDESSVDVVQSLGKEEEKENEAPAGKTEEFDGGRPKNDELIPSSSSDETATAPSQPDLDAECNMRRRVVTGGNEGDNRAPVLCAECALHRKQADPVSSSANMQFLFISVFPLIAILLLILRPFSRIIPSCSFSSLYACESSSSEQTGTDTRVEKSSDQASTEE